MTRTALYSLLLLVASTGAASANSVTYSFFLDTSGIGALSPTGGWLDFEFNQANALDSLSAVATLTGVTLSGDYSLGGTLFTSTGVTGTIPGPIDIPNDQSAANYFTQEITTWGTSVQFSVTLTGPAVGTAAPDGSGFYAYLLDPGFSQIVTPPTLTGEVLNVTIDTSGAATPTPASFTGGASYVTPEPSTALLLLPVLGLAALKRRR
jgi:hypothetical protein